MCTVLDHFATLGRRWSLALMTILAANAAAQAADTATGLARSERLVIFGDSLSDTGNKYTVRGIVNQAPYDGLNEFGVPSDPYDVDGVRFSNGPVWIDHVEARLGGFGSAEPALGDWPHAANYAWGGARAYPPPFDDGNRHLGDQIAAYLADVNHHASPEALHVIFIGGNDAVDALVMLGTLIREGVAPAEAFPQVIGRLGAAVSSLQQNVEALVTAGARRFLILNVPNVGLIPALVDPGGRNLSSCFALLLNQGGGLPVGCPVASLPVSVTSIVDGLESRGMDVTAVDVFGFISGVAGNPDAFGLIEVDQACLTAGQPPYVCDAPNDRVFWDGLHPTKAVHRLLAARVINQLGR